MPSPAQWVSERPVRPLRALEDCVAVLTDSSHCGRPLLAWAHAHSGTEAIIDDLPARRCAAAHGISVRGTLGLVLAAKKHGRISAARPVLEDLRRKGMYLSDRVLDEALALLGE